MLEAVNTIASISGVYPTVTSVVSHATNTAAATTKLTSTPSSGTEVSTTVPSYYCTWSPDNTMVAYTAGAGSAGDLVMVRADDTSLFEIPLATPQGTAVAQFEIARDARSTAPDEAKVVWRARFTLDMEPMGPVHALIALSGMRTAVTLWAERDASAARLRADAPALAEALALAELEPGDVQVRTGEPPRPRQAGAGKFLDRAS